MKRDNLRHHSLRTNPKAHVERYSTFPSPRFYDISTRMACTLSVLIDLQAWHISQLNANPQHSSADASTGFFLCTDSYLRESRMIPDVQRGPRECLKELEDIGVLEIEMRGLPACRWIRLDLGRLPLREDSGEIDNSSSINFDRSGSFNFDRLINTKSNKDNSNELSEPSRGDGALQGSSKRVEKRKKPAPAQIIPDALVHAPIEETDSGAVLTDSNLLECLHKLSAAGKFTTRIPATVPARITKTVSNCIELLQALANGTAATRYTWDAEWVAKHGIKFPRFVSLEACTDTLCSAAATLRQSIEQGARVYQAESLERFLGAPVAAAYHPARPYQSNALQALAQGVTSGRAVVIEARKASIPVEVRTYLENRLTEWRRQGVAPLDEEVALRVWKSLSDFVAWYSESSAVVLPVAPANYRTHFGTVFGALELLFAWCTERDGKPVSRFMPNPITENDAWSRFREQCVSQYGFDPSVDPASLAKLQQQHTNAKRQSAEDRVNDAAGAIEARLRAEGGFIEPLAKRAAALLRAFEHSRSTSERRAISELALEAARENTELNEMPSFKELLELATEAGFL